MNVFDIVGPVMIGPSSSHTAGAARIGRVAYKLLGEEAVKAQILLHGSFAKTYRGHGTDKALVAGILGMKPDDARLRQSFQLCIFSNSCPQNVPCAAAKSADSCGRDNKRFCLHPVQRTFCLRHFTGFSNKT